jgi:ABC-type transport system involved in multi-copper enzyme maturation permease subunit
MSAQQATLEEVTPAAPVDWAVARRQIAGIFRLELRNHLLSKMAVLLYFLAFAPVGLLLLWAFSGAPKYMDGAADGARMFAVFYFIYLSTAIFLGNLIVFMSLFRREILERSLHYYFLTPIRREVLVAGKYVTAWIAVTTVFSLAVSAAYLLAISPWGMDQALGHLTNGPGLGHLLTYVGITALATLGYGAIFLLAGLIFRNPIVPAAMVFGWEAINLFLPAWLKKLSVFFYLQSLFPIPVAQGGLFAILAEPTSPWVSVPGLLLFTAVILLIGGWRARRMEITYGGED